MDFCSFTLKKEKHKYMNNNLSLPFWRKQKKIFHGKGDQSANYNKEN